MRVSWRDSWTERNDLRSRRPTPLTLPLELSNLVMLSPASVQRREVARRIDKCLGDHPKVSAILIFGSVALGLADERSDVDLLVVCRSTIIPIADRQDLLSSVGAQWFSHRGADVNRLFADQDVGGLVDGVPVEVAYQTVSWISDVLGDVLDRGAITTDKVPFRPYTFPALLQRGWLLRDKDGVVNAWRERAQVYPRALKVNILEHFVPQLRECTDDLVSNAERGLGPGVFIFLLHEAWDALRSILLALNEVYDPADKRTEEAILPTLQTVPRDFLSRLTNVLVGPFDVQGRIDRARLFRQLALEALAMAEDEVN
jgi:predicted nucleotidyltransferase